MTNELTTVQQIMKIGHEAHHKGQLILYARMLGVEPPFYVDLSV
jgi:uncharacterized damage-inducible protein DinB